MSHTNNEIKKTNKSKQLDRRISGGSSTSKTSGVVTRQSTSETANLAEKAGSSLTNTNKNEDAESDKSRSIMEELEEIKTAISKTVKTEDLKTIVSLMVKEILKQQKQVFVIELKKADEKNRTERSKLRGEIDSLRVENNNLRELIAEKRAELKEAKETAEMALDRAEDARCWANYNEQYSRKNNVKFFGITEKEHENTEVQIQEFLSSETNTELKSEDIIAVHRIPGSRTDQPRPILVKLRNTDVKGRIIRLRSEIKKKSIGVRLADDVTRENTKLIESLNSHEYIESAWYFNGSVYGKVHGSGRKVKFDICDIDSPENITDRIKRSARNK